MGHGVTMRTIVTVLIALPLVAQPPQNPEQHFSLGIRERGGWLIEHENPRVARQRLGDLHEMLLANAEVADGNVWLEVEVQQLEDFLRAAVEIRRLNDAGADRLASEVNILCNRKLRNQRELLMDDCDSGIFGWTHAREALDLSVDENLAVVSSVRINPADDVHQRRLAGAVLADQRVNLAGVQIERDAV